MDILFTIAIEIVKVIAREVAVFVAKRIGKSLSTSWKQIQKSDERRKEPPSMPASVCEPHPIC
ncbi:hypothetical protein AAHB46_02180 [Bacillus paranthracis]